MRCAVLVAPFDPRSSDAASRREGTSRVAGTLEELGFRVIRLEGTDDLEGDFARALDETSRDDELLVHVSGQLVQLGVLRVAGGRWLPLRTLGNVLALRARQAVSVFADLVHEDAAGDGFVVAAHTESTVLGLVAPERGYNAIAALRPSSIPAEPLAFTELLLDVAHQIEGEEVTLATAYERVLTRTESFPAAQSVTFVRGAADLRLAWAPLATASGSHEAAVAGATTTPKAVPEPTTTEDDPLAPAPHARAFAGHLSEGRADAAFLTALALEELGATHGEHQSLLRRFRSVTPVRAREPLDSAAWDLLRVPSSSPALSSLFRLVARSAIAVRLEQLAERGRLVALDPMARLDETSTASVVRSFQWSSRVLGAVCPALYVLAEVPGDIAAVRARDPSTAVGPSVVSGRSAKDLAFLAGRHLTYYLPEHQVLVYYPTHDELSQLVLAAARLVSSDSPLLAGAARMPTGLSARLARNLRAEERAAIAETVTRLGREDAMDLSAWARGVELTAARAGLFLSGDLATVMALVRTESRFIAGLSFDQKRRDLLSFCVSAAHIALRDRYAVTDPQSLAPSEPPRSDERPGMPPEWHAARNPDPARRTAS